MQAWSRKHLVLKVIAIHLATNRPKISAAKQHLSHAGFVIPLIKMEMLGIYVNVQSLVKVLGQEGCFFYIQKTFGVEMKR